MFPCYIQLYNSLNVQYFQSLNSFFQHLYSIYLRYYYSSNDCVDVSWILLFVYCLCFVYTIPLSFDILNSFYHFALLVFVTFLIKRFYYRNLISQVLAVLFSAKIKVLLLNISIVYNNNLHLAF